MEEDPAVRAARRTATATVWMAAFTVVLSVVSIGTLWILHGQLREMHDGGADTHALAIAAGNQATWTKNLAGSTSTQAERTKDLTDRMKEQAEETKKIADQALAQAHSAKIAADAAQSAAITAKDTLHVSERAYIASGFPILNVNAGNVGLPIDNRGHIPSGHFKIVIHEGTAEVADPNVVRLISHLIETHWKRLEHSSIVPGLPPTIEIAIPAVIPEKINAGYQKVFLVGTISYNDGFPDTVEREESFCYNTLYFERTKQTTWGPCDINNILPTIVGLDKYPNNEDVVDVKP